MRALTVLPGKAGSLELVDVPEPQPRDGEVLVDVVAVGVCGTDVEIVDGEYGEAPPGAAPTGRPRPRPSRTGGPRAWSGQQGEGQWP